MHETGFVHVLHNAAMQDLVKIGFTTKLPEERAYEFSKPTGVPLPFDVSFRALTMRLRQVHQQLADRRVSRKEFFSVSVEEAVATVRACVLAVNGIEAWEPAGRHLGGPRRALPESRTGLRAACHARPVLRRGMGCPRSLAGPLRRRSAGDPRSKAAR
ncbi:GIY-YIG nuclease family protein [Streptomyces goshikiensis]